MSRVSGVLFLGALLLLLASFAPWPTSGGTEDGAPSQRAEAAAVGRILFQAKGCVACHRHDDVPGATGSMGPDLTRYRPNPEFVRDWLRNPSVIRPNTLMPNLALDGDEIEALITFLDSPE